MTPLKQTPSQVKRLERNLKKQEKGKAMSEQKPPIGIVPEWFWKHQRAKELSEAISRYVSSGEYKNADTTIVKWCKELERLAEELKDKVL